MSGATVTVTPSKIELGAQKVTWNGIELGATVGGVTVNIKQEKAEVKADQKGTTVIDRRVTGIMATIEMELAEMRDVDTWKTIFPNATKITGGGGEEAIEFGSMLGASDLDIAAELQLHPVTADDADVAKDIVAYLAAPSEESSIVYGPSEQSKAKLVFNIYEDTATPGRWVRFGDPTI